MTPSGPREASLRAAGRALSAAIRDRLRIAHHQSGCPAHEAGRACCLDVVTDGALGDGPAAAIAHPKIAIHVDPPPSPRTIVVTRPWPGGRRA